MNTFQLSCFLAVANTLSFARAAEQMQISQPAMTHQIKTLENELNVKLFHRSTRMVELTAEGQAFLTDAKSMVAIAEQARLRFESPKDRPMEVLSIGCSSAIPLELLTQSLHQLLSAHPNLHPRLHVAPHEQLFHLLETEAVHAVFDIRQSVEANSRLAFRELRQSAVVCVCRKDHPIAEKPRICTQELAGEPLIFCDPIALDAEVARLQWRLAEGRSPADLHFCASLEAAVVLAGAGFGLAILPEIMAPAEGALMKIPIEDAPKLSVGLFYKPYSGDTLLKAFVKSARQCFSKPVQSNQEE